MYIHASILARNIFHIDLENMVVEKAIYKMFRKSSHQTEPDKPQRFWRSSREKQEP